MKLKFYFASIFLLFVAIANCQEALPYSTDFAEDDGEWTQYRTGTTPDDTYTWQISFGELQHFYPVGGTELTNDWMVSPELDLANGGAISSLDYKFSGFGFPFDLDTIAVYLITGSQNPSEATRDENNQHISPQQNSDKVCVE